MSFKNHWLTTIDKKYDSLEKFLYFIIHHGAITLHGVKRASLIIFSEPVHDMKKLWDEHHKDIHKYLNVSYKVLNENAERAIVLFYNEASLTEMLNNTENKTFLSHFGYENFSKEASLKLLSKRFLNACPHEIGLFLGYPLEDVKCFANCTGTCLMTGYWKVYTNVEASMKQFKMFDEVRNFYASQLEDGYLPSEITRTHFM